MNANPQFLATTAHVDEAAVKPLPNSRKIYVQGSRPDIRVPMREISQTSTTQTPVEKEPAPSMFMTCSGRIPTCGKSRHSFGACRNARRLDRRA